MTSPAGGSRNNAKDRICYDLESRVNKDANPIVTFGNNENESDTFRDFSAAATEPALRAREMSATARCTVWVGENVVTGGTMAWLD